MGFQSWRILRHDLELPVDEARATQVRIVASLLASAVPAAVS